MGGLNKSNELLLKENNERLRLAMQAARMGTWEWDIQVNKVEWSSETRKIFGVGNNFKGTYDAYLEFVPPEIKNEVDKNVRKFLNQSSELDTIQYEHKIIRTDGKTAWIEVRGTLFLDKNNKPLRMVGICSDITNRKRVEKKLQQSEERFALAVKGSNDAIWDWDKLDSDEYWWSDRMYEMLGYKPGEVEARISNWKKWMHPDDAEKVLQALTDHFEKNEPYKVEFRMKKKNGDYIWLFVRGESVRDKSGKPLRMAGSVTDITDKKEINNSIVKAAEEWQTTFDSTNDAIWILDKNHKILRSNKTADTLFNTEKDKIIGKNCWQIVHKTNKPIPECPVAKVRKSLKRESMELQLGEKWFLVNVDPLLDSEKNFTGAVHSISDITEQKIALEQLKESEKTYRDIIEGMNETVWIINFSGDIIDVNSRAVDVLGYSKEEILKIGLGKIDSNFKKEEIINLAETMKTDLIQKFETKHKTKSGKIIPVEVNSSIVNYFGKKVILCVARDISERIKAEKKIREKDKEFRKLSANVPDLIFQFTRRADGSYCVPVASKGIVNIFGCQPEDVKDNFDAIAKVLHPDDAERVIKDIEYSAKNLTYFTCEFRVNIPGKPTQWIFSRSSPEKLPDGSITWYGFNANITERKQIEEELEKHKKNLEELVVQRTKELEEKNKELEEFNTLFVGREFRIKELKDKLEEMKKKLEMYKNN